MVPTESGNVCPASCRDKGRGGVDEGAWCLSWLGYDHLASRNPNAWKSHHDKHQAPTLPHIRPLSLQDGDPRLPEFGRSKPAGRGRTIPFFGYQTSSGRVTHIPHSVVNIHLGASLAIVVCFSIESKPTILKQLIHNRMRKKPPASSQKLQL